MVIFNSYVKLPEDRLPDGTAPEKLCRYCRDLPGPRYIDNLGCIYGIK